MSDMEEPRLRHTCNAYCTDDVHGLLYWMPPDDMPLWDQNPARAKAMLALLLMGYGATLVTMRPAPEAETQGPCFNIETESYAFHAPDATPFLLLARGILHDEERPIKGEDD